MAGSFVTRGDQDGFGTHSAQLYDLSGTGAGPFLPVVVVSDGAGGVLSSSGGSSGSGYTGATATAPGTSGSTATPVQGVTGGLPLAISGTVATTQSGAWTFTDSALENAIGTASDPVVSSGNGTVVSQLKGILAKLFAGISVTDTATETGIGTPADTAAASGANGGVIAQLKGIFAKLSGSIAVTGTFFQATQPVSIAGGSDVSTGSQADTAATGTNITTGAFSVIALLKGIYNACVGATPTGANIIGKVGIDQSSPGITNAIGAQGIYLSSAQTLSNGQYFPTLVDQRGHFKTSEAGSGDPLVGITPVVTQAGTTAVGKNSPGNLYSAYAINSTTTAGYLVIINATSAPSSGAAITPVDVATLGGTVGATASISYGSGPPNGYSTGIVALVTTSLTTYTPSGNAFIQVRAR